MEKTKIQNYKHNYYKKHKNKMKSNALIRQHKLECAYQIIKKLSANGKIDVKNLMAINK